MHSSVETPMAAHGTRVLSCANERGYTAYYLKSHMKVTDAGSFAHRGRCHLLLQPSKWPYPDILEQLKQTSSVERAAELRCPGEPRRGNEHPGGDAIAEGLPLTPSTLSCPGAELERKVPSSTGEQSRHAWLQARWRSRRRTGPTRSPAASRLPPAESKRPRGPAGQESPC